MDSFCVKRTEGRGTENRGKTALHETRKEMAERNQSPKGEHEARESLLAELGRNARLGRPGKWLHSVLLHASGRQLGKRTQQTVSVG